MKWLYSQHPQPPSHPAGKVQYKGSMDLRIDGLDNLRDKQGELDDINELDK